MTIKYQNESRYDEELGTVVHFATPYVTCAKQAHQPCFEAECTKLGNCRLTRESKYTVVWERK